jgi:hypothetical protein
MKALYIIRLTRKPVPCTQTAPKAIAMELILAAAAASGNASIRFAARGEIRSNGYAGKIQIGVIV